MIVNEQLSDEELLELTRKGDSLAEGLLAGRYSVMVRVCARPFFLAGGDSEDLTQEGMLGLLSAIREFRPDQGSSFKSYAELCIRRRILSAIKSASRLKHTPLNEGISLDEAFGTESQPGRVAAVGFQRSPEDLILARESANEFLLSFSRCLSPLENRILVLFLDGLSYRQIAFEIGKDEKSVDNAVQRIRRKLSQHLTSGDFGIS